MKISHARLKEMFPDLTDEEIADHLANTENVDDIIENIVNATPSVKTFDDFRNTISHKLRFYELNQMMMYYNLHLLFLSLTILIHKKDLESCSPTNLQLMQAG